MATAYHSGNFLRQPASKELQQAFEELHQAMRLTAQRWTDLGLQVRRLSSRLDHLDSPPPPARNRPPTSSPKTATVIAFRRAA